MTNRRRPTPDDEAKGPGIAAAPSSQPRWPPAPQSEKAEVALFTVRGPARPGASVIDVNRANRLRMGDAQSPSAGTSPDAPTLQDLVAQQVSAVLEQSGLAEYAARDHAAHGDPGDGADELLVTTEPACPTAVAAAEPEPDDRALTADVDVDPFAERPLDAFPSEAAIHDAGPAERAFDATPSLDTFPLELHHDVPSESSAPALLLSEDTEGQVTSSAPAPAPRTRTAARRIGRNWVIAASIVLALGAAGLVLVRLGDAPQAVDEASLPVRAPDIIASVAPAIGNGTAAIEPAAPTGLDGPATTTAPQSIEPAGTATGSQASSPARSAAEQPPAPAPSVPTPSVPTPSAPAPSGPAPSVPAPSAPALSPRAATAGPARETPAGTAAASRESAVGTAGPPRDRPVLTAAVPPPVARQVAPANSETTPSATVPSPPVADVARTEAPSPPVSETPPPGPAPRAEAPRADSAPAAAPSAVRAAPVTDAAASDGIAEALKHLQRAYEQRDAGLVKAVWPTVNERALARAFGGLRSQSVTFDRCQLNVSGAAGEVECRGVTTYVPRVGGQYQRTEARQWKFRLQKGGDHWVITSAAAR